MEDLALLQDSLKIQPSEKASLVSKLFFCWAPPFFYKSYKNRKVINEEYYAPLKSHKSEYLGKQLEKAWQHELENNTKPSLWFAVWKTFRLEFILLGILFLCSEFTLKMTQPWLIGKLMSHYEISNSTIILENRRYLYGSLIIVSNFISVLISHFYQLKIQHLGMKIRIASCSLIYQKALRISKQAEAESGAGKIVNLLSNDVNRFDMAPMHFLQLLVAPIETIFVIICMYLTLGPTAIFGIVFLCLFVPVQMFMGKLTTSYRQKSAARTDKRIKLMNEIIAGIKVIKMFTWEEIFAKLIKAARQAEIHQIMKVSYIRASNVSFMLFINRTGIFLSILAYYLSQEKVDAQYVFVTSSFYAILRQTLTVYFPFGIQNFSETSVSMERIKVFLMLDEVTSEEMNNEVITCIPVDRDDKQMIKTVTNHHQQDNKKKTGVLLENISVKWLQSSSKYNLKQINFQAWENELVVITGPVGSGKSTLLYTILKELHFDKENLKVTEGTLSYASQLPWLFSGTIRENIVFGSKFDETKYKKIVKICQLQDDFSIFPHGDYTLVGENGALLSGGQKARVSLARAVYKDADIYLLDDPFAAVDTEVGQKIFQNCILEYLKRKCVILVTHHLNYLKNAHRVYIVEEGVITENKIDYEVKVDDEKNKDQSDYEPRNGNNEKRTKTENESRKRGKISKRVYKQYVKAGGNCFTFSLLCVLFLLAQTAASGADYFVAFWVDLNKSSKNTGFFDDKMCCYIYSGIILATITLSITRSIIFFKFCMNASKNLHNLMFSAILKAPMSFFNATPSGNILNRFSKDLGLIDEILPLLIHDTYQIALIVLGSTLLITILNPWMLIPTFLILVLFYCFKIWFLAKSRNLKRLESTARSPVYSHINATLPGLTTIRTYKAQTLLKSKFNHYQDLHSSAFYMFMTCNRAFGFWLDLICVFYTISVILSIMFKDSQAGDVGLGITQSINLIGLLQWGIRQWSELENQMVNVERVVEFTRIHPENDSPTSVAEDWPENGAISFDSVSLRYSKYELILDNIRFTVEPKEKIGIVGRTGAGKTSLVSVLFRLFAFEGRIFIDGININDIPLQTLRSKISIIPQEPVLFTGSLRENLDPKNELSDSSLWRVLEQVELANVVSNLPQGLYNEVLEAGANFSVGQRQLICLARAILRRNKILILDEATANIDFETDHSIQQTLEKNFQNCTILTVAHRINTIMKSDKVLVMDEGKLIEFDHPHRLLQNSESLFSKIVQGCAADMAQ